MKKLIEMYREDLIVCDNKVCDFKIKSTNGDPNEDASMYLNVSCPKCGEILLTEKDHKADLKFLRLYNFTNRWFSWASIFFGNKVIKNGTITTVHFHNGVKVERF
jgi:ssDNA-binding Zn-finger/Zn-ribbon topoisomerase 1